MTRWLNEFSYVLLPGTCILCEAGTHRKLDLCADCESELPWLRHACLLCSIPLPDGDTICGRCLTKKPPFACCYSSFLYSYPIDRMIIEFKENRKLHIGHLLGNLLADSFPKHFTLPDLLIPIPLHKTSLKQRGFNQSLEIAEVLSNRWSVPVDSRNCSRVVKTNEQKSLSLKDRTRNVKDAFAISRAYQGERITIVDDVITTGATAKELARLLMSNGAGSTEVISIARTPV